MAKNTIQKQIIGEILGEKSGRGFRRVSERGGVVKTLGSASNRNIKGMTGNARRLAQSVVKRVPNGGTKSRSALKGQLNYIMRDDAVKAAWTNMNGYDRRTFGNTIERTAEEWGAAWRGDPKRGHTDHIILSFPKGTDVDTAEAISREWGRQIFAEGNFGDSWGYIAVTHDDRDHPHTHFVVNKRGNDFGSFLSISSKSELNYDVMREVHCEIAADHGIALNATSRLSRGIIEHSPRPTEAANAIANGRQPTIPAMSDEERFKREEVVASHARHYRELQQLASMTSDPDGQGFLEKLSGMFENAAATLTKGKTLMTSTDKLTNPDNASTALLNRIQERDTTMRQAWSSIQEMDPSSERAALEQEFVKTAREVAQEVGHDPVYDQYAQPVDGERDPYKNEKLHQLLTARENMLDGSDEALSVDTALTEIKDRITDELSKHSNTLEDMGTNADEVAARYMQAERTEGQLAAWNSQSTLLTVKDIQAGIEQQIDSTSTEFTPFEHYDFARSAFHASPNGETAVEYLETVTDLTRAHQSGTFSDFQKGVAETLVADSWKADAELIAAQLVPRDFTDPFQFDREQEENVADAFVESKLEDLLRIKQDFLHDHGTNTVHDEVNRIIADYDVPRHLQETLARDQIMNGEGYERLADVPAIEAIVDRLAEDLSPKDLQAVRDGDATAIREEVTDPAIRAAVASELRNEADLNTDAERHSEPLDRTQESLRLRTAAATQRENSVDHTVTDDYEL